MSGGVEFNESQLSVVDSWLTGDKNASKSASVEAPAKSVKSAGLGFSSKGKGPKSGLKEGKGHKGTLAHGKGGNAKTGDVLLDRMNKQKHLKSKKDSEDMDDEDIGRAVGSKNKKKPSTDAADSDKEPDSDSDDDGDLHGVVENFSSSRTAMKKKDKKTLAMEAAASKKKSKKEAKSPEMPAMSTEDLSLSYSIERDPKKDENVVLDRHGKAIKAKKKGFWSIVDGSNNESSNGSNANNANNANNGLRAEGNSDAEAPVRKRTKTRSKQKNIRKDNRPADQRPDYRPLTEETKKIMGTHTKFATDTTETAEQVE